MIMAFIQQTLVVITAVLLSTHSGIQLGYVMGKTVCDNPPVCLCNTDMTDVNCYDAGLTFIPDLPVTAVTVDLSWNNIPTIPTRAFSNLSKLEHLYLYNNKIQTIEPLAFEGLESLTDLDLSYNNISTIPSQTFSMLSKLQSVYLGINRIQTIESLIFEGLENVTDLDLSYNNISTIPSQAFSKLSKLQRLFLYDNKIQTIEPLALEGLESLTYLDLSYNRIHTIPTRAFSKLSKLQRVDLAFSHIETIEPLAFEDLDSLTDLLLDSNNIVTIRTQALSKLPILESLDLRYNQIQSIEPFAFVELQNLTKLDLSVNNLQTLEKNSLAYIPRLKRLYLNRNKIQTIAAEAFTGTKNISEIYLDHNELSDVPPIGPQFHLSMLDLSHNRIVDATFPPSYNNSSVNLSIDLSYNKIETFERSTFSSIAGTTIVDMKLHNNNISSVLFGTFDPLKSIVMLYIGNNPLSAEALKNTADGCDRKNGRFGFIHMVTEITAFMAVGLPLGICASSCSEHVFKDFPKLTMIRLTEDDLVQFSEDCFPGKKNVLAIDLAEHDFSSFPECLPTSLERLDLSGNKNLYLSKNAMHYLERLKTLFLARNNIKALLAGTFNGLGNLQKLDLSQNEFTGVSGDLFGPLQSLTHLYFGENKIKFLAQLSIAIVSLRVLDLSNNVIEFIDEPFFGSFPSLHTLNLEGNNLGKYVFQSDTGARLFSSLTELEKIDISSNTIRNLPDAIFQDQVSLEILNLSMNHISGWGPNLFQFTQNISKLDISVNSLSVVRENDLHHLNKLQQLNLKENPFVCNCDLLWFREWIDRTSAYLIDKESYTCHNPKDWQGKPLLEFTKNKINCAAFPTIPTIVGAIAGAVIITVLSGVLVYRNRWRLRLRLYLLTKRGRNFLQDARGRVQHPNYGAINDGGRGDYYDAYISCNELDYDWVLHHLLPGVDNGHHGNDRFGGEFRLYYDPRDQQPGTMDIANIFEHMSRSKRVIVVLTPDYLRDGMNIFELDQATTLYHDQDLDDIIVIKVGDVPAGRVPAHLYTQMRTGRFLEWEQDVHAIEQFKEKLKDRLRGDRVDLC